MSATTPCVPCCATPQVVNVPGLEGAAGIGTNGLNAFSVTTADFVVPAIASTVTISMSSALWLVIGQIVIVGQTLGAALAGPGPATFQVTAVPSATTATLKFLGYAGDVVAGSTISTGAGVSPANGQLAVPLPVASGGTGGGTAAVALTNLGLSSPTNLPLSVYGSGAPYALTTTAGGAILAMGTNPPTMTINKAGTWLVLARARFDLVGATFAANQTLTVRIRRTNNTPADQSTAGFLLPIVTLITETISAFDMPPLIYTTANATDVLELWGNLSALPGAGAVNAVETSLVAVKLY